MIKKPSIFVISAIFFIIIIEIFFQIRPLSLDFYNADGWWKENWLKDRTKYSSEYVYYSIDKFHPALGWTLKQNLDIIDALGNRVTSNSKGIRGKKEFDIEKGEATRVLTLGDSFAFGQCVADDETFSSYLEQLDRGIEAINMGNHAYGTDQQLLKLKNEGMQYEPDIIILGFVNENLERNRLKFRDFAKPKFLLKDGELILQDSHIKSPEEYKKDIPLHTINYVNVLITRFRDTFFKEAVDKHEYSLSKRLLEELISVANSTNAQMVLLYLPDQSEILEKTISPHVIYKQLCDRTDIICVDPSSRMLALVEKVEQPSKFFNCHYSKEIHQAIAAELYDKLKGTLPNSRSVLGISPPG